MATIKILKPSIDDYENTVVIRGVVDDNCLAYLNVDFYQRELLPSVARKKIREALSENEKLPDIELGMRGNSWEVDANDDVILNDPVFIIDGQQRRSTALEFIASHCDRRVGLGAVVHLGTNPEWEKERFRKLNQYQVKVSANVLIRNNKDDHPLISTMYGLSKSDRQFVLYDRVCWSQNMTRNQLMSAVTMIHVIMNLHSHLVPGRTTGVSYAVANSDKLVERIGLPNVRANIKAFFNLIDECWGIRRIHVKGGAPYIRRPFLEVLARVISDHPDFWKGQNDSRLEVPYTLKRKLSGFYINDPEVVRLASATGAARLTLYTHIIGWLNSGKREKRLVSRNPVVAFDLQDAEPNLDDADVA